MKILCTASLFICAAISASPAHAALSGFYDSAEQISTILQNADISNMLKQAPIAHVSNKGTRDDGAKEWEVRTQECDLKVFLTPISPNGPGKITYAVAEIGKCD